MNSRLKILQVLLKLNRYVLNVLFSCFLFLFIKSVYARNSIKKFTVGNSSIPSTGFKFDLFIAVINQPYNKIKYVSHVFRDKIIRKIFCLSIIALCLKVYICPSQGLFYFSISFKLITPIFWNNLPFTRLYFASNSPDVVINVFSVSVFIEFEKSMPSRLNLRGYFLYFSNLLWILSFFF